MKNIDFIGPAVPAADGGLSYRVKVDDHTVACRFTAEALEDVNPSLTASTVLNQFEASKDKLLEIARNKINNGEVVDNIVWVKTQDL